jgi:hypothetical protein
MLRGHCADDFGRLQASCFCRRNGRGHCVRGLDRVSDAVRLRRLVSRHDDACFVVQRRVWVRMEHSQQGVRFSLAAMVRRRALYIKPCCLRRSWVAGKYPLPFPSSQAADPGQIPAFPGRAPLTITSTSRVCTVAGQLHPEAMVG